MAFANHGRKRKKTVTILENCYCRMEARESNLACVTKRAVNLYTPLQTPHKQKKTWRVVFSPGRGRECNPGHCYTTVFNPIVIWTILSLRRALIADYLSYTPRDIHNRGKHVIKLEHAAHAAGCGVAYVQDPMFGVGSRLKSRETRIFRDMLETTFWLCLKKNCHEHVRENIGRKASAIKKRNKVFSSVDDSRNTTTPSAGSFLAQRGMYDYAGHRCEVRDGNAM